MTILFFDDEGLRDGNEVFVIRLRRLTTVEICQVRTVFEFEARVTSQQNWLAIILDIMAHPPPGFSVFGSDPPELVRTARTGLELLRRCRLGVYGEAISKIPIYMRSARGEEHIIKKATKLGASGYFDAGGGDNELIMEIKTIVGKCK